MEKFTGNFGKKGLLLQDFDRDRKANHSFCDITLVVDGQEFHAHKILLAKTSNMFRTMFTTSMKEKFQTRIEMQDVVSAELMQHILDYIYTGNAVVKKEDAAQWICACDYFQLHELKKHCQNVLCGNLNSDNCLSAKTTAMLFNVPELELASNFCLGINFTEIVMRQKLEEMSQEDLVHVLQKRKTNYEHEDEAFEAILKWVKHDEENRRQHLFNLLKGVHLRLLPIQYLEQKVCSEPLMQSSDECRQLLITELLQKAKLPKSFESKKGSNLGCGYVLAKHNNKLVLLAIPSLNEKAIPNLPDQSQYSNECYVKVENMLFCISKSIYRINLLSFKNLTWKKVGETITIAQEKKHAILFEGFIFVMVEGNESVEIFDPKADVVHCHFVSSLPCVMRSISLALYQGYLICAGNTGQYSNQTKFATLINSKWQLGMQNVEQQTQPILFEQNNILFLLNKRESALYKIDAFRCQRLTMQQPRTVLTIVAMQNNQVYAISADRNNKLQLIELNKIQHTWSVKAELSLPFRTYYPL